MSIQCGVVWQGRSVPGKSTLGKRDSVTSFIPTSKINSGPGPSDNPKGGFEVVRVAPEQRLQAAGRLVSEQSLDPLEAARRFLDSAASLKIDLSLMWATVLPGSTDVRQVCLSVIGSGRTAMLFVSGPTRPTGPWFVAARRKAPTLADANERTAVITAACQHVHAPGPHAPRGIILAQALLEAREKEAAAALRSVGFAQLGELAYMRLGLETPPPGLSLSQEWPAGVAVRSIAQLIRDGASSTQADAMLSHALEHTYVDTQDCPELCGLRELSDVLESHKAVGVFDPELWWIVLHNDQPKGCALFSVCPEQDSVELVYIGICPSLRGGSLGRTLFRFGLAHVFDRAIVEHHEHQNIPSPPEVAGGVHPQVTGLGGLTCAVDSRNAPAVRMYRTLGFQKFATRVPFVKRLPHSDP